VNIYSDLRSKLGLYQTNRQDIKKEKKTNVPDIVEAAGGTVLSNDAGEFFVIEKHYGFEYNHGCCNLGHVLDMDLQSVLRVCKADGSPLHISDLVFLDTETTGLSVGAGTVAFLIGIGFFTDTGFLLRQYFMRDYDEESAVLKDLNQTLSTYKGLVTFNGKGFDWNLLQSRFVFNRQRLGMKDPVHLDLLYPSRMLWKQRLESCRLSSLEENILKVRRIDDIPGALVPGIYFKYLSHRNTPDILKVIHHNELDILSLITLLIKINSILDNPLREAKNAWDLLAVAQIFEKYKEDKSAVSCYEKCLTSVNPAVRQASLKKLAFLHKGKKDYTNSVKYFETLLACSGGPNIPVMIEIAKHYEHRAKDIPKAVKIIREAIDACLKTGFLRNMYYHELKKRFDRLNKKSQFYSQ
jgi:uncharacterized protein YprB with RNaseH-like and TPR domain